MLRDFEQSEQGVLGDYDRLIDLLLVIVSPELLLVSRLFKPGRLRLVLSLDSDRNDGLLLVVVNDFCLLLLRVRVLDFSF